MAYTTIDDPTIHFTAFLRNSIYGGSDTSYDIGFQPDWIWDKVRSTTGVHATFDSVRGVGSSGKILYTNTTGAEATNALIKSIDSSGFTITANSDHSSQTIVDWCWKAGGTASSNSDGDITSSVSANTTAGFSIVSYTGTGSNATIGHGLGVTPKWIIVKQRNATRSWEVFHSSIPSMNTKYIELNTTAAASTYSPVWGGTDPTSTTFHVGTDNSTNNNSGSFIAYCFAEKKGYSKFGSYTGNGNNDGTFVYTGFAPAYVMIKKSNASGTSWVIFDNKRNTFNERSRILQANDNGAEETSTNRIDFTSNGFKLRGTWTVINNSGDTYIYMAFAESPFVNSNGVPNNAR